MDRLPRTAAVVATAATAAFAAYAVGSQTNSSGQAGAHGNGAPGHGPMGYGPPPGGRRPGDPHGFRPDRGAFLSAFAKRLGVTTDQLRTALQSLRPSKDDHAAHEDAEAQALADALGIDKAKVTAAFDKVRPDPKSGPPRGRPGEMGAALAKELGVTTAQLRAAFDKVRTAERDAFAQKLADKLGISADKVKSALADGPFGGGPGFHGPRRHH